MSEAPPDEHWVQAWLADKYDGYWPEQVYWYGDREGGGVWIDEDGDEIDAAGLRCFSGWTPTFRPLEPDAPEPEAQTMPPTPQRLRLQIVSAAQESVALGQARIEFLAMASIAHVEAMERAARVGR